jgi:predicted Zn-dependent protease
VNRGAIAAADNEAQIAGVMAHEIGHVVMRHGTHQMSKVYLEKMGLGIFGGIFGGGALGSIINATGGFGLNALFLHYSREMESEADLIGTQILHDAGYDPKAMVDFFEKIQEQSKGGNSSQFFSDHPNPANRISDVQKEIVKLNGALPNPKTDTSEFQVMKTGIAGLPAPLRSGRGATAGLPPNSRGGGRPAPPSMRTAIYDGVDIQFRNPDNWRQSRDGNVITVAPEGGVINGSLAWGMTISPYDSRVSLDDATDQVLGILQRNNPAMRITRDRQPIRVGGMQGYALEASNDSPAGGQETDSIVTVIAPNGRMYYFIGVAPQNDFFEYRRSFQDVIDSIRFKS